MDSQSLFIQGQMPTLPPQKLARTLLGLWSSRLLPWTIGEWEVFILTVQAYESLVYTPASQRSVGQESQLLLPSPSPGERAGWWIALSHQTRGGTLCFRIQFKYHWDKQHDLFNVSLKRKWHSWTEGGRRAKLDSVSQFWNKSGLRSPKNPPPPKCHLKQLQ